MLEHSLSILYKLRATYLYSVLVLMSPQIVDHAVTKDRGQNGGCLTSTQKCTVKQQSVADWLHLHSHDVSYCSWSSARQTVMSRQCQIPWT